MYSFTAEHSSTIDDLVFVEDKIVTYKYLTKQLGCHINISKQALYLYIKEKGTENVTVTYLITGTPQDGSGQKVIIVKESEVDEVKKTFKNVISEHVYSVQKAHSSVKPVDIYLAHSDTQITEDDWKHCSIKAHPSIVRVERNHKVSGTKDVEVVKPKKVVEVKPAGEKSEAKKDVTPLPSNKKSPASKESKVNGQKESLPVSKDKSKNNASKAAGSIGSFFSRQASRPKEAKPPPPPSPKKIEVKEADTVTEKKENIPEPKDVSPVTEKKAVSMSKKEGKKKDTKRKKYKDVSDSKSKKRRRIQIASDSESSEEEVEVMDVDEAPPSPINDPALHLQPHSISDDDECIPPTPVANGRKRIRKQVDRTYTDEEGFILTKKEYVYESCSDDENTPPEKKVQAPVPAVSAAAPVPPEKGKKGKAPITPTKNKQASIMSFFKKK